MREIVNFTRADAITLSCIILIGATILMCGYVIDENFFEEIFNLLKIISSLVIAVKISIILIKRKIKMDIKELISKWTILAFFIGIPIAALIHAYNVLILGVEVGYFTNILFHLLVISLCSGTYIFLDKWKDA